MGNLRRRALFLTMLVLASGALLGASAAYFFIHIPTATRTDDTRHSSFTGSKGKRVSVEEIVQKLEADAQLGLSDAQRQQLTVVMRETRERFRLAMERSREETDQIRETSRNQIRQILTAEQMERFDELMRRSRGHHVPDKSSAESSETSEK